MNSVSRERCPECGRIRPVTRTKIDLEYKIGKALGITPGDVRFLAETLWNQRPYDERAMRAQTSGDQRRGALGHITREMIAELRKLVP